MCLATSFRLRVRSDFAVLRTVHLNWDQNLCCHITTRKDDVRSLNINHTNDNNRALSYESHRYSFIDFMFLSLFFSLPPIDTTRRLYTLTFAVLFSTPHIPAMPSIISRQKALKTKNNNKNKKQASTKITVKAINSRFYDSERRGFSWIYLEE